MQPNQPPLPPNYDFILNNGQQNKGPAFFSTQDPRKRKLLAILFAGVVITLVLVIVIAMFSSGGGSGDAIKRVIAQQTEIIRIVEIAQKDARDPALRNQLATLLAVVGSDLQQTSNFANQNGIKLTPVELASAQDSALDDDLESAKQRGTFDDEVVVALEQKSESYKQALSAAINEASGDQTRQLLSTNAQNILTYEAPQTANN